MGRPQQRLMGNRRTISNQNEESNIPSELLIENQPNKDECLCFICMDILCKPQALACCQQRICEKCLNRALRVKNSCPHCRQRNVRHERCRLTERLIEKLSVYCDHSKDTTNYKRRPNEKCTHTMTIGERKSHLSNCEYKIIVCKYCSKKLIKKDLGTHSRMCGSIACTYCSEKIPRHDLQKHKSVCPKRMIRCKGFSEGCSEQFSINQEMSHYRNCLYAKLKTLKDENLALKRNQQQNQGQQIKTRSKSATVASKVLGEGVDVGHHNKTFCGLFESKKIVQLVDYV
eukprot:UN25780